jgi:Rieske Fe-S protein
MREGGHIDVDNNRKPFDLTEPSDAREQQTADALETYIAALRAGRRPSIPDGIAPEDIGAFQMAARMHAHATPNGAVPDASFVANLGARLAAQLEGNATMPRAILNGRLTSVPTSSNESAEQLNPAPRPVSQKVAKPSRRAILTGGLVAAAGIAAGVTGGVLIDSEMRQQSEKWPDLVTKDGGDWLLIAHVGDLAPGTVKRFVTSGLTLNLIRRSDGSFKALSAACTHMGCLVSWNAAHQTFDCPCHNGRFDAQGNALSGQPINYRPLPVVNVKVDGDEVYVWAPTSSASASDAPTSTSPSSGSYQGDGEQS